MKRRTAVTVAFLAVLSCLLAVGAQGASPAKRMSAQDRSLAIERALESVKLKLAATLGAKEDLASSNDQAKGALGALQSTEKAKQEFLDSMDGCMSFSDPGRAGGRAGDDGATTTPTMMLACDRSFDAVVPSQVVLPPPLRTMALWFVPVDATATLCASMFLVSLLYGAVVSYVLVAHVSSNKSATRSA